MITTFLTTTKTTTHLRRVQGLLSSSNVHHHFELAQLVSKYHLGRVESLQTVKKSTRPLKLFKIRLFVKVQSSAKILSLRLSNQ